MQIAPSSTSDQSAASVTGCNSAGLSFFFFFFLSVFVCKKSTLINENDLNSVLFVEHPQV